ncbi:MAG: hypothetical protein GTO45_07655 [Candidatus Aminicenantes bacterium]|nr:hypothetical protein [Candidatus Aminicenantes bacterium]NIM78711.1 hypothetical protein [Candidatus Aminicenantes bacterium]NIN17959.1 hypothetical protein [Candidatus Aminicenantes bacterium]NIN41862.1 hypothetical protein [Candidatus Aminicenantes bacterium]NIN84614.1 hypothetical protein [Candidatus Aminicenantes bacterium]
MDENLSFNEVSNETSEETDEKKKNYYEPLEEELRRDRVALDNTLEDPSLQGPFASYGLQLERIQGFRVVWTNAESTFHKQLSAYERQFEATRFLADIRRRAGDELTRLSEVARIALKGNVDALQALGLKGKRSKGLGKWIQQAKHFYNNALASPTILEAFARYNVTPEDLQNGLQMILEVETADTRQERAKGDAQKATEVRDAAFKELRECMSEFYRIAKLAFADDRQQLEKLGIVAKS